MSINNLLDVIFEDVQNTASARAIELVKKLEDAEQYIRTIRHQLSIIENKMSSELAIHVRKTIPGLHVAVGRYGCKIGYRTKQLVLKPDPKRGQWKVSSSDKYFANKFKRRYASKTFLHEDIQPLVSAVVEHFTNYYKSLGEDIVGTGVIIIESDRSTFGQLMSWNKSLGGTE